MAATFIACLGFGLDYGMLIGIVVNLMFILYNAARPKVQVRNLTVSRPVFLIQYMLYNWRQKRLPEQYPTNLRWRDKIRFM
jgi:MFS superfamily sulfate permease-like transporter